MATYTVSREPVRSDVLQAAKDFATSINKPYVAYPVTAYQMYIIVGDWNFYYYTFENADIYAISFVPANGNVSSYLRFSKQASAASGTLENPWSVVTYSSAAHTMQLTDKGGVRLETVNSFAIVLLTCWLIVRDIFSNVSRH